MLRVPDVRLLYLADIRFPLERANGIQTMETCHALAARGHEVTLVVRSDPRHPARDPFGFYGLPRLPQLRIWTVALRGPNQVRRAVYLARAVGWLIACRRFDVVFTRDLGVTAMLLRVPRALRPPIVHESHSFAPAYAASLPELVSGAPRARASKQRRLMRRERQVWRGADGYVSVTAGLQAECAERFGPRPCASIIRNGVRLPPGRRFVPPEFSATPLLVYAGQLYPWKGVDFLLRALPALPDVRLMIVGGYPFEPDLASMRALAGTLGVSRRVTFTGLVERPRVQALLAEADMLVLPIRPSPPPAGHTSPLKLFEYLAAGKPIVASDLPSVREILRDGDNAVLVEPGHADALAAGVRRVLGNRPLAERIARQAFHQADQFGWDRRAERLEALIGAVIASRAPQAGPADRCV